MFFESVKFLEFLGIACIPRSGRTSNFVRNLGQLLGAFWANACGNPDGSHANCLGIWAISLGSSRECLQSPSGTWAKSWEHFRAVALGSPRERFAKCLKGLSHTQEALLAIALQIARGSWQIPWTFAGTLVTFLGDRGLILEGSYRQVPWIVLA